MNELIIQNKLPRFQQAAGVVCASFLAVWSIYVSFSEVLASRYTFLFYVGIAGLVVALLTFLLLTVWVPKPLLIVSPEGIYPNLSNQSSLPLVLWSDVLELSIGLNYLLIALKTGKTYNYDLSTLKYADLKELKSKLVELCESKDIPYKNA